MGILELPPPTCVSDSEQERAPGLVSCKLKEATVTAISTGPQFADAKLVSVFLAAYHCLLYRYNPTTGSVKVGLPSGKPRRADQNGVIHAQGDGRSAPSAEAENTIASITVSFHCDSAARESNGNPVNGSVQHDDVKSEKSVTFSQVLARVEAAFPGAVDPAENSCSAGFEFCGSPASASRRETDRQRFEIFLRLSPGRDGSISTQFEYKSELYDEESMTRLAHNYVHMLESLKVSGAAEMPIYLLPLLTEQEKLAVLDRFSKRAVPTASDRQAHGDTLVDILERQARRNPDAVAVIDSRRSLTYLELYNRAREVASALFTTCGAKNQSLPTDQPELIGLGLERGHEWVVAMAGVLMAGMGYCPLDPAFPRARIEKLVDQAGLKVIFSTVDSIHQFSWLESEGKARVLLVEDQKGNSVDMKILEERRPSGSDVCYVLFTSGSTGEPKGVVAEHQGVRNLVNAFRDVFPRETPDIRGQLSAMTFDLHAMDVYCTFDAGGTLVICSKDELLTDLQGFIRHHQVTGVVLTPTVASLLNPDDVPSLRWLALAGETVPRVLLKKWINAGRTVIEHYGPTECAIAVTCQLWRPADDVADHIGRPLDGAHVYVLGPNLELLPIGVPGEICISGIHVARGYLKRPDLTSRSFRPNPYSTGRHDRVVYKTGDRGRWLQDGNVQFLGRVDFQIKIRGNRVEPGEIEKHISSVDGVARCVVILREDEPGRPYLAAYMMSHSSFSREGLLQKVQAVAAAQLPSYMMPAAYVLMDQLPLTVSGKVDRQRLPQPSLENFQSGFGSSEEGAQCINEEERMVAHVFSTVLGLKDGSEVFRNSNFFALGGNSFLSSQAVAHLHQAFALPPSSITIRQFFERPTAEAVAEILKQKQKETFLTRDGQQQKLVQAHLQRRQQRVYSLSAMLKESSPAEAQVSNGLHVHAGEGATLRGSVGLQLYLGGEEEEEKEPVTAHHHVAMHVPLSHAQEVMWVVTHTLPNPEVVDISDVWKVQGTIDPRRLEDAVQQLQRRHQALRMRFSAEHGGVGSTVMAAVLNRWAARPPPGGGSAGGARVASMAAGFLGPVFLRNMHKIVPKCVDQIDQDYTIVPFTLASADVTHAKTPYEQKWELRRALDFARRPFDMKAAQGLLFRVTLIRGCQGEVFLVCVFNHLIFDGISAAVFYRELEHVYRTGTTDNLPAAATYADYVAWEKEWLAGGAEKAELAYWVKTIGRNPEPLRLQATHPPKTGGAIPSRGAWLDFSLDSDVRSALEAVAHGVGATLNMAALAAFHSLLHIWSNQRRIVVGTLMARRPLGEHQGMLGHVADVMPIVADFKPMSDSQLETASTLRAAVDPSKDAAMGLSFKDVLHQVKERVLEALENQSVTLRHIVSEVLTRPEFAKSNLIQAYFNFLQPGTNSSPHSFNLGEAHTEYDLTASWAREGEAALTPVCLILREQQDGSLRGRLVYQADIIDRPTMEAMMFQYCNVVRAAARPLPDDS